jgi:hypothetical protein
VPRVEREVRQALEAWVGARAVPEGLHRVAWAALVAVQVAWGVSRRSCQFLTFARVRHGLGRMMST